MRLYVTFSIFLIFPVSYNNIEVGNTLIPYESGEKGLFSLGNPFFSQAPHVTFDALFRSQALWGQEPLRTPQRLRGCLIICDKALSASKEPTSFGGRSCFSMTCAGDKWKNPLVTLAAAGLSPCITSGTVMNIFVWTASDSPRDPHALVFRNISVLQWILARFAVLQVQIF